MDYWGGGGSKVPQYPEAGAMVDFYLAELPDEPLTLDIMAEDGTLVRRFVGKTGKENTGEEKTDSTPDMMAPGPQKIGLPDSIEVQKGHNRFTWDLRYPNKTVASADGQQYFGVGAGPLAVPGNYKVRLTAGDWSQTRDLNLQIDPRVKADGVSNKDLQAQLELNLKIRNAIGQARKMAAAMDTLESRIDSTEANEQLARDEVEGMKKELEHLQNRLVTAEGISYPPPMLIDQMEYMYYMTISADQRPGEDAYTRFQTLNNELKEISRDWEQFKEKLDLPKDITD
jgi:outer membrane murein-binding lipoprotein Lpp